MKVNRYTVVRLTRTIIGPKTTRKIAVEVKVGDIVRAMYDNEIYQGRIEKLENDSLMIDCSRKYNSQTIKLFYNDIWWIRKLKAKKIKP